MDTKILIAGIIDTETRAFDTQDVDMFLSIIHPDMVWPWPPNVNVHNPQEWVIPWGRFNKERWHGYLDKFFNKYRLIQNIRDTKKIVLSKEEDGAFAVVDVNTLWRAKSGDELHWKGRICKIFTTYDSAWVLISQVGPLDYSHIYTEDQYMD